MFCIDTTVGNIRQLRDQVHSTRFDDLVVSPHVSYVTILLHSN